MGIDVSPQHWPAAAAELLVLGSQPQRKFIRQMHRPQCAAIVCLNVLGIVLTFYQRRLCAIIVAPPYLPEYDHVV
jgi:hypothetical protein